MEKFNFKATEARMRELSANLASMQAEDENYGAVEREYNNLKREYEMAQMTANTPAVKRENKSLVAQIREAVRNNQRSVTVNNYTANSATVAGIHDQVVGEEIQDILAPLYTTTALKELGVRFFPGLPQGDVKVPIMGKNTVAFEGEITDASASTPAFSAVTLKPKRITAFVDVSKQLLLQDNKNTEQAIMNDLIKAVGDKLEAVLFGYAAGTTTQPKGMFWDATLDSPAVRTLADANTFAKVVAIEGALEDDCVNLANCKYLLSPKAKATLRTMATNGNGSPRALTNGTVDGTPAVVSANVKDSANTTKGAYIYGDWSNLAVGTWSGIEVGIYDDSRTATGGVIRLVLNAYVDAQVLREGCFKYGDVRHA